MTLFRAKADRFFNLQAGDYRRLLHRPSDLQWALLRYGDPDVPLNAPDAVLATGAAKPLQGAANSLLCAKCRLTPGCAHHWTSCQCIALVIPFMAAHRVKLRKLQAL